MLVGQDLPHPAMGLELDTGADCVRPVGDVGRRFRALRAGRRAMAEIDAARPALIIHRGDRGVRRPPVPAELVHGLADQRAGKPERLRRHRRARQRRHRIARKARDAHHPVVLFEERRERVVINRPVISDAVERLHLEIGRVQPRPMRGVHHGRAADAVEVHHLDRRVVVIDRIVLGPAADVRTGRPVTVELRLPVTPGARIFRRLHPAALVEAEDMHLGLGQTPGHRRAGRAGADDQDVNGIVFVHSWSLNEFGVPTVIARSDSDEAIHPSFARQRWIASLRSQ